MKYVIIIIVLAVVLILWMMKSPSPIPSAKSKGVLADLSLYLSALLESDDPYAFLIVTHESSGDFLQFTAGDNTVQMDFPLITEQQKNKAEKIKATCSNLGLVLEENKGSEGSEFYDWNLTGSPDEMSKIISSVFTQAFEVKEDDSMEFAGIETNKNSQPENGESTR